MWSLFLLVGCSSQGAPGGTDATATASSSDSEGDADTDADGDADSDGDTDTGTTATTPRYCDEWTLEAGPAWTQADLFGSAPLDGLANAQGPGVALGDLDGDGWEDALLAVSDGQSFAFRNDGAGTLVRDDTFTVDGGPVPIGQGVALTDLDDDGDLDAALAVEAGYDDLILENDGSGHFTSTALPDSQGDSVSPAFADIDGDGDLDLFLAGFKKDLGPDDGLNPDPLGDGSSLYVHESDGTWTDASSRIPEPLRHALTHHAGWLDADLDGDLDLMLANEYTLGNVPDALLLNDGSGQFTEATGCLCNSAIQAMGVSVADVNGDQQPDMFITNLRVNQLLLSIGNAVYYDATRASNALALDHDTWTAWAAPMVDLDGDGDPDIIAAYGPVDPGNDTTALEQNDLVLLNDGTGVFTDATLASGLADLNVGRGMAVGDLDRDGRPDIVTAERVGITTWYGRGGCPPGIRLTLDAGPGNHSGIGTMVEVTTPDLHYWTWALPSETYSSDAPELFLGLGGRSRADLVITWPDGTVSARNGISASEVRIPE